MSARLQQLGDVDAATIRAIALVDLESSQHRRIGTYSKGMRQRIKIAAALVHDPQILLLDEPFNGMDPRQRLQMMEVMRGLAAGGRVVVISSHILEELNDLATNVLVMVSGRLAASGHFREIRRLMTDRPHTFNVRSSDDRALGASLLGQPSVFGIELSPDGITVRTAERGQLTRALLPLTAVVIGTTAFAGEIDDGTIVYTLVKPIARSTVVLTKYVVAVLSIFVLMAVAIVLCWVALIGFADVGSLALAFVVGAAV